MMVDFFKKIARTFRLYFPFLKDPLYGIQRWVRNSLHIPIEQDFEIVRYFPDEEGILFLDIGANNGAAIDALLMFSKKCLVYSYEPNPIVYSKIIARFSSESRVKIFNTALGETNKKDILYVPVYNGYEFDGLASTIPGSQNEYLAQSIFSFDSTRLKLAKYECSMIRLDDLELNPYFIKIDVEGYEAQVLRGVEKTIQRSHPILLVEDVQQDDDVMKIVKAYGYEPYCYEKNNLIAGKFGSPNTFLMTREKYETIYSSMRNRISN